MIKTKLLILLCSFLCFTVRSQTFHKPGNCISYEITGSTIVFNCSNQAKLSLKLCNDAVVKIWYSAKGDFKRSNESFAVIQEQAAPAEAVRVETQPQAYEIFTGKLRIRINKNPLQLQIFDKYQRLLFSDYKDLGHVSDSSRIAAFKTLRNDEQFFGLGEKAGPLNRRGREYKMWNSDKPCYSVSEDPLYKSIPFFLSSYKYGIFFDNTYKSTFRFGSASSDYYSFESAGGELLYYFLYGEDYKQIFKEYIALTGKPIMPPKWALGFSQCRGLYTNESLAREVAAEFRKRQIPCDIIYQDIGWVDGLQTFDWDATKYKDPPGMIRHLDSMGFKMIVSQDPVISQASAKQWREADSLHYFATDVRSGKSYDMPWPWGGNCGVVDFTNPAVADWWGKYQQKPLNDGVRGFWTDMGEPAWSNEEMTDRLYMKHYAGMHEEIHNVYGLTWDKVVKEQFDKHNPGKRIFQMTRSAYAGLQRYTFGWSGDSGNGSNVLEGWNQLANQIPLGLSAGMGLIPFWATDISGYCGDIKDYPAMAALYTRWMQFGVFNPLSRAHHEGNNAAEPWLFGKEAEDNCRRAIQLKYRLFPYIYTYSREAYDTGLPLMRALFLEYPDDAAAPGINDQFMFGKELLVAPVVKKNAVSRQVYLPEGEWIDFNDGKTYYEGGQTITYPATLSTIPVFVKKGAIIPLMPVMQFIHEKKVYPITFKIFPAVQGQEASFELYEDDGESLDYQQDIYLKTVVRCITSGKSYDVQIAAENKGYTIPGKRNFVLKLYIDKKPASVTVANTRLKQVNKTALEKSLDQDFGGLCWSWDEKEEVCYIKLPGDQSKKYVQINK